MAMTGEGLAALRQQYIDAVPAPQTDDSAVAIAHSESLRVADSQAIVDYITQNAKAVGTDTGTYGGDSHNLDIE